RNPPITHAKKEKQDGFMRLKKKLGKPGRKASAFGFPPGETVNLFRPAPACNTDFSVFAPGTH
ncbi:MAG: hypothetical protein KGO82_17820, partial [Bacteroidota bacterium]|nr:hypothetical protein [Bacteroidota bacterium]